jgi:homoserine O-acetyltransferase
MAVAALRWSVLFGALLSVGSLTPAMAEDMTQAAQPARTKVPPPWDVTANPAAQQQEAWFDNYQFRDGETLTRLRIHYATLGKPHRDAGGLS